MKLLSLVCASVCTWVLWARLTTYRFPALKMDSSRQNILYVDLVLYARMLAQSSHADFSSYIYKWKL